MRWVVLTVLVVEQFCWLVHTVLVVGQCEWLHSALRLVHIVRVIAPCAAGAYECVLSLYSCNVSCCMCAPIDV